MPQTHNHTRRLTAAVLPDASDETDRKVLQYRASSDSSVLVHFPFPIFGGTSTGQAHNLLCQDTPSSRYIPGHIRGYCCVFALVFTPFFLLTRNIFFEHRSVRAVCFWGDVLPRRPGTIPTATPCKHCCKRSHIQPAKWSAHHTPHCNASFVHRRERVRALLPVHGDRCHRALRTAQRGPTCFHNPIFSRECIATPHIIRIRVPQPSTNRFIHVGVNAASEELPGGALHAAVPKVHAASFVRQRGAVFSPQLRAGTRDHSCGPQVRGSGRCK